MARSSGSLGAFSVDVLANIAQFESDLGRANRIAQREAEKMKQAFTKAAGLIGVGFSAAAFTGWIKGAVDAQDKADELAQKVGITTAQMSKLQIAARFSATDVDGLGKAMQKMSQNAAEAATGSKEQAAAFSQVGVAVTDANGKVRDGFDIFTDVAEKFAGYEGGVNKTALAVKLFGRAGADLIPMFNDWNGQVAEAIQLADEFGATVSSEAGAAAGRFNDQLAKLGLVSKGVSNQIAEALLPALNDLADAALRFFRSDQWKRILADISAGARWVADNLDRIIGAVKLLGTLAAVMLAGKLANALTLAAFSVVKLTVNTYQAATAATVLGKAWIAAGGNIAATTKASIKSIGVLPGLIGSVTAAFAGWQIGTYLREQFLEARLAGIAFVEGTQVGWLRIKQAALVTWEIIASGGKYAWDLIKFTLTSFVSEALTNLQKVANAMANIARGQGQFGLSMGMEAAAAQIGKYAEGIEATAPSMDGIKDRIGKINAAINTQIANTKAITGDMAAYEIAADAAARAANAAADGTKKLGDAGGDAAPNIDSAAESIKKLNDEVAKGQEKLAEMAGSFADYADPMDAVMAKFDGQIAQIGRAAEEQQAIINSLRQSGGEGSQEAAAAAQAAMLESLALGIVNATAARDAAIAAIEKERDVTSGYMDTLAEEARLIGMTSSQYRVETIVLRALAEAKKINAAAGKEVAKVDEARIRQQAKLNEALGIAANVNQESPFQQMLGDLASMQDALAKLPELMGDAFDPAVAEDLERAIKKTRMQLATEFVGAANESLKSIQSMTKEGSRSFQILQVAIDATTVSEAILALVHQLSAGDVYTAIPRMLAVAAAIASLGVSVGNVGAGGGSTAAQRQATQGTGSVLGDSEAKSESIANAIEITADATTELVGINRGMLVALQALQDGLSGAANQLARGAGDADFSGLDLSTEGDLSIWEQNDLIGRLLGGSSEVTDQGIIIFGGALNDMLNEIAVGAYQEVQSQSSFFGSTHTNEGIVDVSDQFGRQFQLVIGSIVDTVRAGAEALGLLPADIEAAIAAFQVEEIRISLMDLSAEEQQAELAAVFSQMFDGLAGAIVPFIEQFQQVGEGLGETLVRVATGVQVTQEAMRQLDLDIDETDPERFAQISEGLMHAVGGVEAFIDGMNSFVSAFADDGHRLQIATEAMNSAFEQVGLKVPATEEGMWALMQSLDATTEAGREQIATLLRLSGTAREFYDMLENAEQSRVEYLMASAELQMELGESGGFVAMRAQVEAWANSTIDTMNALARAAGRAGASEQDLVNVHRVAAQRVAELIDKLKDEASDLAVQLGYITGTGTDTIESLNAQIDAFGAAAINAGDAIGSAVDAMREKINLLLGDLSPFNDQRKLQIALEGLAAGTVDPEQVLEIGRRLYASTAQYTALFNQVMGMANFGQASATGNGNAPDVNGDGRTLQELIAARDALLAAQRPEMADELARRIAEIAYASGNDFADVAASIGFSLDEIASDMSISNDDLTALLQHYFDEFDASSFTEGASMIESAINVSRDAIVDAIDRNLGDGTMRWSDSDARAAQDAYREDARKSLQNEEMMLAEMRNNTAAVNNLAAAIRDYGPRNIVEQIR